jgi:hypothetical protein
LLVSPDRRLLPTSPRPLSSVEQLLSVNNTFTLATLSSPRLDSISTVRTASSKFPLKTLSFPTSLKKDSVSHPSSEQMSTTPGKRPLFSEVSSQPFFPSSLITN